MAHATNQNNTKQSASKSTVAKSNKAVANNASTPKKVVMTEEVKREKGRPSNQSMGLPEPEYMKQMAIRAEKRGISLDEYMAERKANRKKAAQLKKAQATTNSSTPMAKTSTVATTSKAKATAKKETTTPVAATPAPAKTKASTKKAPEAPVMEEMQEETRTVVQANGKVQKVVVKSTSDYDKFSFHPANRHVIEARVRHLVEDIAKNNMLHLNPIIVDMEWRIVNGQHRFRAAKELGLPLYYIQGDVTAKEMLDLNANQKALALKDYLDSYVAQGYPEYIKVKEFIDKYKTVLYNAIGLLSGRRSQPNSELVNTFKDGDFQVRDLEHAEHIMKIRDRMAEHASEFYTQKNFTNAVAKVADMENFDEQHFIKQVDKKGYGQLHPAINTELYATQLVDLYNHGLPKKKQLHLEGK